MGYTFTAFSYVLAIILDTFLIFFSVFHIIALDELKSDFKNPIDQCNTLNSIVLPEYAIHILLNFFFFISGEWVTVLLNIPLIAYHINRYMHRPLMSRSGLYDPTTIMGASQMNLIMKEGWVKLLFYLFSFFYYIYGMITSLIVAS